jgi:hypothetical protein
VLVQVTILKIGLLKVDRQKVRAWAMSMNETRRSFSVPSRFYVKVERPSDASRVNSILVSGSRPDFRQCGFFSPYLIGHARFPEYVPFNPPSSFIRYCIVRTCWTSRFRCSVRQQDSNVEEQHELANFPCARGRLDTVRGLATG